MMRLLPLLSLLLLPAPLAAGMAAGPVATPAPAARPAAAPIPASDLLMRRSGPVFTWRWRAAPEVATQRALLMQMRGEAQARALKARRDADGEAATARAAGFPMRAHEHVEDWALAADTQRLLALAGTTHAYTGGAHGNTRHTALLWDKAARRTIRFADLFADWPAARARLEPAFCTALADERQRRLAGTGLPAGACPDLAELPILPFADVFPVARQWRVLVAPYVAGAYAEGSYLITLQWPDGITALVQPRFRRDLGLQ